ncbi:MAG: hypothetical protein Q8N84_04200 [bacterium]|nr:hypothetical protein [bacterium]
MKVTSTTCTIVLGRSSAYGDATLENGSTAHWVASRFEGGSWGVSVTVISCSKCSNSETIAAVKEAALAKIAETTSHEQSGEEKT